ncbi:diacylglycerol kinase [Cohnella sp. CIP 111063]|uniref:diacylglycerol kinase family protein n=1 Tax=unclassified Cohnella TaxID=2636738 RepID=UPI000B8BCD2D|nr:MULTISPECIES: diacylglycerol kinase family protein [unclassified Cohnella]OXS62489.1 diacylglycerol kinase [Cohnella sp. CIP 111063]PRX74733.1 undecaprenol kinase [Cohnella sp. SGD-V74]
MSGWRSREVRAFRSAWEGLTGALRHERHMRFHAAAAVAVVLLALWLDVSRQDWLWLLLAIAGVCSAELVNTAVERTVDRISTDVHPLAKTAKDSAAGAVLVMAIFAVVVGLIVLGPPLWRALFQ